MLYLILLAVAGLTPAETRAQAADQAGDALHAALAWDDVFAEDPTAQNLIKAARAYARAGEAHCLTARARFDTYLQRTPDDVQARHDRTALAQRCHATLSVAGIEAVTARPVNLETGAVGPSAPVQRAEDNILLWPGAWALTLGTGPSARSLAVCVSSREARALPIEHAAAAPAEPAARATFHQQRAADQRATVCARAVEMLLANHAKPDPIYLLNAGMALTYDDARCPQAARVLQTYRKACPNCAQASVAAQQQRKVEVKCAHPLRVNAPSPATITIDGVGGAQRMVFPGLHLVEAHTPDGRSARQTVWMQGPQTVTLELPTQPVVLPPTVPPAHTASTATIATLSTGAVLTVGGTILLFMANERDDALSAYNDRVGEPGVTRRGAKDIERSRTAFLATGWTALGLGIATSITGLALYGVDASQTAGVQLTPTGFVWTETF
jgi:hypothetical protein